MEQIVDYGGYKEAVLSEVLLIQRSDLLMQRYKGEQLLQKETTLEGYLGQES